MAGVNQVEHLGLCHCHNGKTEIFADSGWSCITLALVVHVRGRKLRAER